MASTTPRPTGTPVHAAGNGVVVSAGWMGGYGRTVRLRHPNGYETLYGHLSRIDVSAGQRVAQGTRVGAVGSTGISTGPHLDYRMSPHGRFIDPLRLPTQDAEPIATAERAAFDAAAAAAPATAGGAHAARFPGPPVAADLPSQARRPARARPLRRLPPAARGVHCG